MPSRAPQAPPTTAGLVAACTVGDLRTAIVTGQVLGLLAAHGLVVFDQIPSRAELVTAASAIMDISAHPDADPDGVTTITDLGPAGDRPNAAGFSARALAAHTDRSGVARPPALLMLACARSADRGGASLLTDGAGVHDDLARTWPQALHALLTPRSVLFGGAAGHLASVLADTDDPDRRQIRLRLDDQVAFGPGTAGWLSTLTATIRDHTTAVTLRPGQGIIVDNHRWLHARTAFTGARRMLRILGDPHPTTPIRPGIPLRPRPRPTIVPAQP